MGIWSWCKILNNNMLFYDDKLCVRMLNLTQIEHVTKEEQQTKNRTHPLLKNFSPDNVLLC